MLKKLLILPLLGGLMSFGAFASASDLIGTYSFANNDSLNISIPSSTSQLYAVVDYNVGGGMQCQVSLRTSDWQYEKYFLSSYSPNDRYIVEGNISSDCSSIDYSDSCYQTPFSITTYNVDVSDRPSDDLIFDVYCSFGSTEGNVSLYSGPVPSDDPDNGGLVPTIPDSFTSGLTSLVNNFGSTVFNWLPTIILVALGIYAIFALFRVVRNYARSSFNG